MWKADWFIKISVYIWLREHFPESFYSGKENKTGELLLPSSLVGFHFCNLYFFKNTFLELNRYTVHIFSPSFPEQVLT